MESVVGQYMGLVIYGERKGMHNGRNECGASGEWKERVREEKNMVKDREGAEGRKEPALRRIQ